MFELNNCPRLDGECDPCDTVTLPVISIRPDQVASSLIVPDTSAGAAGSSVTVCALSVAAGVVSIERLSSGSGVDIGAIQAATRIKLITKASSKILSLI